MSLVVVGSVAIDDIISPAGEVKGAMGGAASYFAYIASLFNTVNLVGVIGEDYPQSYLDILKTRDINLEGLEVVKQGQSFYWKGKYVDDFSSVETLTLALNVFESCIK